MRIRSWALAVAATALLGACKDSMVPDYNNPSQADYQIIKSRAQLQSQVTGLIDGDRQLHDFQILAQETVGRDVYRLDGAEPRYITVPLGNPDIGNVNFMQTAIWNGPYANIRSAKLLISATEQSTDAFPTPLTDEEKNGVYGVAQTFKALQYMRLIEMRDTVGVPIATSTGTTVDPIRCEPAVLDYIAAVLDSADANLQAAGDAFAFELPGGFTLNGSFDTPATFRQFERGLKAKVEIYRAFEDYRRGGRAAIDQSALDLAQAALNESFYDRSGSFKTGVYHVYSTASGDYANPNYNPNVIRINPRVVDEAVPGDLRVPAKVNLDTAGKLVTVRAASSPYQDKVNSSPTAPLALLTNAELILLQAEIYWGKGQYAQALAEANVVRTSTQPNGGGLAPATNVTEMAVLHEILYEKRYALLFESVSRHVDYRMFGLLMELGPERGFDEPVGAWKIPTNEVLARGGDIACQP